MYRQILRMILLASRLMVQLLPVVIRAAMTIVLLMITSTVAVFTGVPEATDKMAKEWAGVSHDVIGEGRLDVFLYWFFRGLALLMLTVGWICMALFTVAILDIIGIV